MDRGASFIPLRQRAGSGRETGTARKGRKNLSLRLNGYFNVVATGTLAAGSSAGNGRIDGKHDHLAARRDASIQIDDVLVEQAHAAG